MQRGVTCARLHTLSETLRLVFGKVKVNLHLASWIGTMRTLANPIHLSETLYPRLQNTDSTDPVGGEGGGIAGITQEARSLEQTGLRRELAGSNLILSTRA